MSIENELPEGWMRTTLEQVTAPVRITILPKEYPHLPYVGMEQVEAETMKLLGTVPANELKSNAARFWPGDVLYGRLRPYLNKVLRPGFEGLCSPEFLVFPQSVNVDAHYLQYFLNSWKFRDFATHLNEGDRPRVDWDQLKIYKFPLAPLREQRRIVAAIEQQFSRLDAAVTSLQHARAKLKRQRAAILKAAVEGTLTTDWRAQHPASETAEQLLQRILHERRAKWESEQLAKMQARGVTPKDDKWKDAYKEPEPTDTRNLPELPEGWVWASLEQLITYLRNGLPQKPDTSPPGNRILRINAVRPMHVDLDEVRYLRLSEQEVAGYFIENGDILFTRYNGSLDLLGVAGMVRSCYMPTLHPDKLIRVKTVLSEPHSNYVELASNVGSSRAFLESRARTTAGQKGISGADIKQIPIPLPPLAEQQQIVSEVEARLSIIAQTELEVEANLKRAERLRQTILAEAFAGRLVPQHPDDEPASVLLERIRGEHDGMQKKGKAGNGHARNAITLPGESVKIDVEGMEQVKLWESVGG